MDIATGTLSRDEYLHAIHQAIEFLESDGIDSVLVAFGWGCDCPEEQLYEDVPMKLACLQTFISESEAADWYRVGKDNLHVKEPTGRAEFLFCHEADIHFITEDGSLCDAIKSLWLSNGYKDAYEKHGANWRRVAPNA